MSELGPLTLGALGRAVPPATRSAAAARVRGRSRASDRGAALSSLAEEVMALSRHLRRATEAVDGLSRGRREVLTELERRGPQTVPQMARSRSVTRQHVQSQVNQLVSWGYVEFATNPAHKRSHLVRLTEEGNAYLAAEERTEFRSLSALDIDATTEEIARTVRLIRELTKSLQRGADR